MATPTLTRAEVRKFSKELKDIGSKLPRQGYCVRLADGREICRDHRGYYLVGMKREGWDRFHRDAIREGREKNVDPRKLKNRLMR